MGNQFDDAAWGRITPGMAVVRHQCQGCGFQFFDPSLAGNEAFYRQLEHAEYFAPDRPEFSRSLALAARQQCRRVLDVGCGSGFFLDAAKQAGLETWGLELNGAAAAKARAKGHRILDRLLDTVSMDDVGGPLDLITFFQVLEHVPDPVAMLKEAARLVRPGGVLAAAVPSASGFYRLTPWDPHQWPPHHVSHWRPADLRQLAASSGLKLLETGGDRLFGTDIERGWKLHNRLAAALGHRPRAGGDWLPDLGVWLYRKTGMKYVVPQWGVSLYAHFQKP